MIERLQSAPYYVDKTASSVKSNECAGGTFSDLLMQRVQNVGTIPLGTQTGEIEFSKHAQLRAQERGIEVDDTLLAQLSDSVERAQAKGAKNILAFDAGRAFIINVAQNRVVTAISGEEMQDNVFTNIDGAVLLK